MPTQFNLELREKFIRETEELIDRKRKTVDQLLAEAEGHEADITQARELLQLLKTGKTSPNGAHPQPSPIVKAKPKPKPEPETPVRKRKPQVRISRKDLFECAKALGPREFTTADVVAVTGLTQSGASGSLNRLLKDGLIEVTRELKFIPGQGNVPRLYRVVAGR